jgi:hypothetical protein
VGGGGGWLLKENKKKQHKKPTPPIKKEINTPPRNLGYIPLTSKTLDWFGLLTWHGHHLWTSPTDWLPSRVNGTTNYRRNSVLLRFHTMKKAPRTKARGLGHSKPGRNGWRWLPDGRWIRSWTEFSPCVHTDGEQNQIVVNVTYCTRFSLLWLFFLIKKIRGGGGGVGFRV